MANVKQPADHLAKTKSEDAEAPSTFEYKGSTYTIPAIMDWPLEVQEALEDEKFITAARELLGQEQWEEFKTTHRPTSRDLEPFFEALGEALNVKN